MSNRIAIIGRGGLGHEVFAALVYEQLAGNFKGWVVSPAEKNLIGKMGIIATDDDMPKELIYILAIGNPQIRAKLMPALEEHHCPTYIFDGAHYYDMRYKRGNVFCRGVVATTGIEIGSFNYFNLNSTIGHDARIGDCNVVNPTVNISGGVVIGNNCLLGSGAVILENIKIGNNVTIGAGSVVTKNIPDGETWVGVPATPLIKKVSPALT